MSSQYCLARATISRAWLSTLSRSLRSWWAMWMSEEERKTCRRGFSASRIASQPWSTSLGTARQSVAIWVPRTSLAIRLTASKSAGEAAAKPASMQSTPIRSSSLAICSFSSAVKATPAACSPSRRVVSKISTLSAMTAAPLVIS